MLSQGVSMAVIFELHKAGKRYQVRKAGQSIRLYTDGVFHSQYNPRHVFSGGVWDMLSVPALLLEEAELKRALILGVGGGAALCQLRRLFPGVKITGVELDPVHIQLMKKYFGVRQSSELAVIHDDAIRFASRSRRQFDLVVDDLFIESDGEPCRVPVDARKWSRVLLRRLSGQGVLVMNFHSRKAFLEFVQASGRGWLGNFENVYSLRMKNYENLVAVFSRQGRDFGQVSFRLESMALNDRHTSFKKINFRWRRERF
jgi:spermidine synthase